MTEQNLLTDLQIGYLAGIIDGEGYIGLGTYKGFSKPRVRVGNTNLEVLEVLQTWCGGNINVRRLHYRGWKDCYELAWTKYDDIIRLLELIEPYLIIKRPQAQLLLAWCTMHQIDNHTIDNKILYNLHEINRKGVKNK